MTFSLRTAAISIVASCALVLPMAASARPITVARVDGSIQALYTLRGRLIMISKISRRHLRHRNALEQTKIVLPQKEII